jgi:putative transposase
VQLDPKIKPRVRGWAKQQEIIECLRVYRQHYKAHRPHRALGLLPPNGRDPTPLIASERLRRRDLLGALIHEYEAA